jgi:SAM-dependent methyltransferase
MSDWSAGYVTEVGYTHGYYRELLPSLLAFACLARGAAAPGLGAEPIRVLELGCGQGLSANIIAAANPHIDYTAIDFNPQHIAGAQALAKEAATPNVRFIEASFEEVGDDASLSPFDVITLHGIYTWVSAENREHIIRIARDKLKTGGLLYVSYNCYPGWSSVIPIRRMFTDTSEVLPKEPIFDRLAEGLRLFDRLKDIKARYIAMSPGLIERMEQVKKLQRNYVAHEYLNGEWTIFHSPEVAADMARAKLSYVGPAHLLDNVDTINFTAEQSQFLAEIKDPTRREYFRDLILNQQFRRDIFIKGPQRLGFLTSRDKWLDLRLALPIPAVDVSRKVTGMLGEAALQDEVYEPIVAKLSGAPKTVRELIANPSITNLGWARLQEALIILLGQAKCHIALPSSGEAERAKRAGLLNLAIMRRARESTDIAYLASPVIGGAIDIDRIGQLFLLAAREKAPDRARFVWDVLKIQGQKIVKDGKVVDTEEENLAGLAERAQLFAEKTAPVLDKLGIK